MVRISMHTCTDKQGNNNGTRLKVYITQLSVNCLECTKSLLSPLHNTPPSIASWQKEAVHEELAYWSVVTKESDCNLYFEVRSHGHHGESGSVLLEGSLFRVYFKCRIGWCNSLIAYRVFEFPPVKGKWSLMASY